MKITIQIPDEAYELLGGTQQLVQSQITQRLKALPQPLSPDDKLLIIDRVDRQALEQVVGRGLDTPDDLLTICKTFARVKVGVYERQLTTSEASRIAGWATSMGVSTDVAIKELVEPILEDALNRV